jgi:hypothetical protein
MARVGHRVLSATTKAKIAASLRGNKNAYSGGPKKRLTSREKVANINARTKANKLNLSDAQIRQRTAVAKRLRARARTEEAGIKPDHSKSIPTPSTITQRDSKLRADASRMKGSIAKAETKSVGRTEPRRDPEAARAAQARQNRDMANTKEARRRVENARKQGTITTVSKEKLGLERAQQRNTAKRVAKTNTGDGNFSNSQNKSSVHSAIEAHDRMIDQKTQQMNDIWEKVKTRKVTLKSANRAIDQLAFEKSELKEAKKDLQSKVHADRSKPSTDPLTKATSKPKVIGGSLERRRAAARKMGDFEAFRILDQAIQKRDNR